MLIVYALRGVMIAVADACLSLLLAGLLLRVDYYADYATPMRSARRAPQIWQLADIHAADDITRCRDYAYFAALLHHLLLRRAMPYAPDALIPRAKMLATRAIISPLILPYASDYSPPPRRHFAVNMPVYAITR